MSPAAQLAQQLPDEEATTRLGARFARGFERVTSLREQPLVLYLSGDLGAGKTCFARGLIHAFAPAERVRSPTYTLVERHVVAGVTVLHLDLYRLIDASELEPLALREQLDPGTLWLIEWPERAAGRLPAADLTLRFEVAAPAHAVLVAALTAPGTALLAAVQNLTQEEGVST